MTTSDKYVDLAIETQIKFTRLANKHVKEFTSEFDAVTKQLRDYLVAIEYPIAFKSVANKVESILEPYHVKLGAAFTEFQEEIAEYAAEIEVRALQGKRQIVAPSREHIMDTLNKQMLQGAVIGDLISEFIRNDKRRVVQAVNMALTYGRPAQQIASSVAGSPRTKAATRNIARRGLELLIRSTVQHALSAGRDAVWQANPDLVKRVLWVSVLDSKTSDLCQHYDGKTFDVKKGPRPPAHFNCRSTVIPMLPGLKLPHKQTWFEWLDKQPQYVQREALGVTRFNLWKQAGVAPQKFLDASGEQYTLHELKQMMPKAFDRLST